MKQKSTDILTVIIGFAVLFILNKTAGAFSLNLGIALMIAFVLGEMLAAYGLPRISSYLILGIIVGPYALEFFSESAVKSLQIVDSIALSSIAFVAGGDINFRKGGIPFSKVLLFVGVQFFAGLVLAYLIIRGLGLFLEFEYFAIPAFIIFLALILNAVSPATTVAIIKESKAKGKLTKYTLSAAVVKDFIIIVFFSMLLSFFAKDTNTTSVAKVIIEELMSGAAGVVTGIVVYLYIKYVKINVGVLLFLVIILATWVCKELHLNNLMLFIVAGVYLNNFTTFGRQVVDSIDSNFGIILLVFFFSAGMVIDLNALYDMMMIAVLIVLIRVIILYFSSYLAANTIREDGKIRHWSFMGFVGQAGVSIGFAKIIASIFPFGEVFQTLVLAVVGINQVIGPVMFRFALKKCKEIK
jgi:Kef-type K+ transport system membrane component KefB